MKALKRIDLTRCCFYQLPDDTTPADLSRYEILYRAQYKGIFRIRTGTMYIFELPDTEGRDLFLKSLESAARHAGLIVQRIMYYPD